MPSYGHLFAAGNRCGEDLVAYLGSLGKGTAPQWYATTQAAALPDLSQGSILRGKSAFRRVCAPCHGAEGFGDGPLASSLWRPSMNLRKGRFWAISWGPGALPVTESLARLIRYGLPGTAMPGHESLEDQTLADLVTFVLSLQGGGQDAP